jgi:hypothetical protein
MNAFAMMEFAEFARRVEHHSFFAGVADVDDDAV